MRRRQSSLGTLAAAALLLACGDGQTGGEVGDEVELVEEGEEFLATLCFPAVDGLLRCEPRAVQAADNVEETAAVIVQALIDGPASTSASASAAPPDPDEETFFALPPSVRLLALDLVGATAYVDLTVAQAGNARRVERPALGVRDELLAVYSLVNSLTASDLGIERVVLMWNGEQRPTFAGHIDTTRPLLPDLTRNAAASAGI